MGKEQHCKKEECPGPRNSEKVIDAEMFSVAGTLAFVKGEKRGMVLLVKKIRVRFSQACVVYIVSSNHLSEVLK